MEKILEEIDEIDLSKFKEFDRMLTKKFGEQYTGFGNKDQFESIERVPLQCISLNRMMGGGIPVGRIIEIFGDNSVGNYGKSNL